MGPDDAWLSTNNCCLDFWGLVVLGDFFAHFLVFLVLVLEPMASRALAFFVLELLLGVTDLIGS